MTTVGRLDGLAHLKFRAHLDPRGALIRTFDDAAISADEVDFSPNYALASVNPRQGTLRGMHLQRGSAAEARLISCATGAIHNITVDIRRDSPTYLMAEVNVLCGADGTAILVPPGCANGWITLDSNTVVCYQVAGQYCPEASMGIRFDDPAFGLEWPIVPTLISDADKQWPDFHDDHAWVPGP